MYNKPLDNNSITPSQNYVANPNNENFITYNPSVNSNNPSYIADPNNQNLVAPPTPTQSQIDSQVSGSQINPNFNLGYSFDNPQNLNQIQENVQQPSNTTYTNQ